MTYSINFSTNAAQAIRDIQQINRSIGDLGRLGQNIQINVNTARLSGNIRETFRQLNTEIGRMETRLSRLQIGSRAFTQMNAAIGYRQGRVERGQMIGEPLRLRGQAQAFGEGTSVRLGKELQAAQIEASQLAPNTAPWIELQQQIGRINTQLQQSKKLAETIQMRESLGAFSPGSLASLETRLTILKNSARNISPNTEVWRQFNDQIQRTERSIQRINRKPLSAGQRLGAAGGAFLYGGGMGGGAGSALGGIAGGLMGGVPGAFTGAAVGQFVDNMGQQAAAVATLVAEINKSKIALAGVSTNVDDYNKSISAATSISSKFLLPISDGIRQFTKLKASVVGAGYSTETTTKVFNGIAAAIIGTGGSTEDLNSALLATSQVFSKGKVSAEELRGQIGERLPGAFTLFAKSIGKAPQDLDKLLQEGKVSLKDFIKFTDELNTKFGKTAEILASAPENAGPRLKVALQAAAVSYGGLFQVIGAGFQNAASDIVKFALVNEDSIKRVVTVFAIGFNTIGGLVASFGKFLVNTFNTAFTYLLGNLDTVVSRIENAINRAKSVQKLTPDKISQIQDKARTKADEKFPGLFPSAQKSTFYNAYFNKLIDEASGASKETKYTDKVKKILFPTFNPTQFGGGTQGNGTLANLGGGGTKKSGKTLADYFTDEVKKLQELQAKKEALIDSDASLSNRERDIQKAEAQYYTDKAIAIEQYNAAIRDQSQYTPATRGKKMQDLAGARDAATALAGITYTNKLTDPFRATIDEQKQSLIALGDELTSLKGGQQEMNAVEKNAIKIKQDIAGLNADQIKSMQPLIQMSAEYARQIDNVSNAMAQQRALIPLQNQLALARTLDPTQELRLGLQQSQPNLTPEQIDQQVQITKQIENANKLKEAYRGVAGAIGDSFGQAFKGVVSGSMTAQQALSGFFQSVADSFLDMIAQMIAAWLKAQVIQGFMNIVGAILPGFGTGIAPGPVAKSAGVQYSPTKMGPGFANGGIATGGFRAFASGGVVSGPTLGLVGEGRYNEAVIPLPDGKSVPVDLGGANGGSQITSNIVVNVNSDGQSQSQQSGNGNAELGKKIEGAVKQVIVGELRPGGLLAGKR